MRFMVMVAAVSLAGCLEPNDKFMPATDSEGTPPPGSSTTMEPPPPTTDVQEPDPTTAPPPTMTMTPDTGDGPLCGNGAVEADEECDDGDAVDGNDCTNGCKNAKCGDGIVWMGKEPCDDGNDDNGDGCLIACKFATCGDGFLYVGKEECDDGNDDPVDECTTACKEPACGDGFVKQELEECDDGNATPWDGCEADCVFSEFWMFVTSDTFDGDLGGLAGADMICNDAAMAAQLPGPFMYKAWLSDGGNAAAARIMHGLGRYRRTDGVIIADTWGDLTGGQLNVAINLTEFQGAPPPADSPLCGGSTSFAYTNTSVNGGLQEGMHDCMGWNMAVGPAWFGDPKASDAAWTAACEWMPMDTCETKAPIYCVQEPAMP